MNRLPEFVRGKKLISVRRENIDDHSIQGCVLAFSKDLILLQYVFDFILDGLMVLRTSDITEIKCSATDEFQRGLLITEELFQLVPFGARFELRDWKSILTQFSRWYPIMILEDERPEENLFLIGKVQEIKEDSVWLQYFSGAANWDDKPTKLPLADITCCRVGTNYVNMYQRHFERTGYGAAATREI